MARSTSFLLPRMALPLLGGLVLGIVEAQAQWYLGAAAREIVVYGLLFLCLMLLPGGLAGVRDSGAARKL